MAGQHIGKLLVEDTGTALGYVSMEVSVSRKQGVAIVKS